MATIYRDVDSINLAGIPVRSTSGVGGGFEIMQEYKIDKKVFSTADKANDIELSPWMMVFSFWFISASIGSISSARVSASFIFLPLTPYFPGLNLRQSMVGMNL